MTKIENGNRHISVALLLKWCDLCHVDHELYEASARLAWVAEASPVLDWFEDFFRAQVMAHTIRTWHPIIIPGLLQTPEYLFPLSAEASSKGCHGAQSVAAGTASFDWFDYEVLPE